MKRRIPPRVPYLLAGGLLIAALLGACGQEKGDNVTISSRDIDTVMQAHVNELMGIPGVVGVAIGALDDSTPCIKVYVVEETDEIKRRVPTTLEGHPVRVEVSGEIKPMSGK